MNSSLHFIFATVFGSILSLEWTVERTISSIVNSYVFA
jgi:hypothetical protein